MAERKTDGARGEGGEGRRAIARRKAPGDAGRKPPGGAGEGVAVEGFRRLAGEVGVRQKLRQRES